MAEKKEKVFALDDPRYIAGYADLRNYEEERADRLEKTKKLKQAIEQKYNRILKEQTREECSFTFEQFFDAGFLSGKSEDIVMTTGQVITSGKFEEMALSKRNSSLIYNPAIFPPQTVANCKRQRFYSYIVDQQGKVWDPITLNFGTQTKQAYLKKMVQR
ncbi:hypothetical protein M1328_04215 [Patescibacteria group bacterium]|nr:hypothetical protein [Patescibacteria group bacterium]